MKKRILCVVLALLCLNFWAKAQEQNLIKPLKVGDKVPEEFWKQEHQIYSSGKIKNQNLASFRSKLLILDFWATWCGSCIHEFPSLINLEKKFDKNLSVMLVNSFWTRDSSERISARLTGKLPPYKSYDLPSIIKDSVLLSYFPHNVMPNYVWIMDNEVRAITTAEFVTEENVENQILRSAELKNRRSSLKNGGG